MDAPEGGNNATTGLRRPMQDYTRLLDFLSPALVTLLSNASTSEEQRCVAIVQHVIALGLRTPSEHSMALLTALHVFRGVEHFTNCFQLHSALESMKLSFRKHASRAGAIPAGQTFLLQLPCTVAQSPAVYAAAALPTGVAVLDPSVQQFIFSLAQRVPLRKSNKQAPQQQLAAASAAAAPANFWEGLGGLGAFVGAAFAGQLGAGARGVTAALPAPELPEPAPAAAPLLAIADSPTEPLKAAEDQLRCKLEPEVGDDQPPGLVAAAASLLSGSGSKTKALPKKGKPAANIEGKAVSKKGKPAANVQGKAVPKKGKPAAKATSKQSKKAAPKNQCARKKPAAAAAARKAGAGPCTLKNTLKCVTSRAYHQAKVLALKKGLSKTKAKAAGRRASAAAATLWHK
ncbi:unnamed protein product [Symbiodinium natans]|uniref:Uncharacterized protein n=1 Tax=Symbiodinium natans TaxID=878477 RepID=A0A812RPY1_9DINO|nr:unnamed protein product [Symbiodinium natans]